MMAYFEKCVGNAVPAVDNEVTRWHVAHGWCWNVLDVRKKRYAGVFFATLLCGSGAVLHFDTCPGISISPAFTLSAFRKAIRMVSPCLDVIYATIPEEKQELIQVMIRLGFGLAEGGEFVSDGKRIKLLKYFGSANPYIIRSNPKG